MLLPEFVPLRYQRVIMAKNRVTRVFTITDKHLKSWVSNLSEKKLEQSIGNGVAVRASSTGVVSFYFRHKENGKV
jgi:hypothetical protein